MKDFFFFKQHTEHLGFPREKPTAPGRHLENYRTACPLGSGTPFWLGNAAHQGAFTDAVPTMLAAALFGFMARAAWRAKRPCESPTRRLKHAPLFWLSGRPPGWPCADGRRDGHPQPWIILAHSLRVPFRGGSYRQVPTTRRITSFRCPPPLPQIQSWMASAQV